MPGSDFGLGQEAPVCPVRRERPASEAAFRATAPSSTRRAPASCSNTPPRAVADIYARQPLYSLDRVPVICGSPGRARLCFIGVHL